MDAYRNRDTTNWDADEIRRGQGRRTEEEAPRREGRRAQASRRASSRTASDPPERPQQRGQAPRARTDQSARARRRRKRRIWILLRIPLYFLVVLVASYLLAQFGWQLAADLCAFDRGARETTSVVISAGDSVRDVADKLYEAGLIRYRWFFRLFAHVYHAEKKIGAGIYELNTDMDYHALIVGMRNTSGNMTSDTVRITIPEGYSLDDIFSLLEKNGVATWEELAEAAKTTDFDYDFIDNESESIYRLEGYLFPDTYDFFKPERPVSAINKLLSNFERKLDNWEGELAYAESRGYDLYKIVTIASLIEKETDGTDQARIASVIYNRLDGPGDKAGTYGLLQIDAALLYALPDHTGPITSADLETDSPYNLYKNPGLPPTPIADPGAACIKAALTPESTDYYYYALAKDGRHRFFSNYREFSEFLASGDYIGN